MLLHLSDLHFGTEKQECLLAIRHFCQQHHVEVIAVSGDLTQRARIVQFLNCKKFLDSLRLPYLVVPGNHDIPLYHVWQRVFSPFHSYKTFFGELEDTLETENFYLVGVNSIRRHHHTKGHISLTQIDQIAQKLKHGPEGKLKCVVVHQPFYVAKDKEHGLGDCPDRSRIALEQWSKYGLFGLLHGHLHLMGVYNLTEVYQLDAKPIFDIHAGTATSWRLRKNEPNGFNVILKDGAIAHYIFDEITKEFILKKAP